MQNNTASFVLNGCNLFFLVPKRRQRYFLAASCHTPFPSCQCFPVLSTKTRPGHYRHKGGNDVTFTDSKPVVRPKYLRPPTTPDGHGGHGGGVELGLWVRMGVSLSRTLSGKGIVWAVCRRFKKKRSTKVPVEENVGDKSPRRRGEDTMGEGGGRGEGGINTNPFFLHSASGYR